MSRTRSWSAAAIVAVLALAAGVFVASRLVAGSAASAEPFFAATFVDLNGESEPMTRWRGKLVVVNFWATWCPPCLEEMPDLQAVHNEYAARGVRVVGLGIDAPAALRRFRDQLGLTLPLYAAGVGGSELGRALGNSSGALPYTVVISADGRIVRSRLGQVRAGELRGWLDHELAKRAS